jgi:hypothetical protein
VTFCWYARDLGADGLSYLHSPQAHQHPLYPAAILVVQRAARALGAADAPLTWQRSAQAVSWLAGMTVVALVGVLTARLVRRLALRVDEGGAALAAMLWTALLDLHVWLSSDAMSDELHLAFYLAAVIVLLKLDTLRASLACGVLAGLAFLTRPEGAVPMLGGLAMLAACWRQSGARPLLARAAVLALGFLLCATPYWCLVGRLSAKKNPVDWLRSEAVACEERYKVTFDPRPEPAGAEARAPALAKLEPVAPRWYALLPHALYKLFRAGRVLIPLLALLPLRELRKRLVGPVLAGWTTSLAAHFGLTLVLLQHYGYLDPRHMLVPVTLLVPLAAMLVARVLSLLTDLRWFWAVAAVLLACYVPPAAYALRVPNSKDRFLVDAAGWLKASDADVRAKRLLSGGSPKRIAFYADMRWESWAEKPEEYPVLARQVRVGGPGYLAIETGAGFEREGNRELVDKLLDDRHLARYLGAVQVRPGPDRTTVLYFIELRPPQ